MTKSTFDGPIVNTVHHVEVLADHHIAPLLHALEGVPERKYKEADQRAKAMQAEMEASNQKALESQTALAETDAKLAEFTKRNGELERDTTVLGTSLRQMTKQYDKMNTLNNELLDKYNALLSGNQSENRKLLTNVETLRLELMNKEDSLDALARTMAENKQPSRIVRQSWLNSRRRFAAKDAAMKSSSYR